MELATHWPEGPWSSGVELAGCQGRFPQLAHPCGLSDGPPLGWVALTRKNPKERGIFGADSGLLPDWRHLFGGFRGLHRQRCGYSKCSSTVSCWLANRHRYVAGEASIYFRATRQGAMTRGAKRCSSAASLLRCSTRDDLGNSI